MAPTTRLEAPSMATNAVTIVDGEAKERPIRKSA
jgi:hypothetical protein